MTRTYVVTGAASGIGAATARHVRDRGHRVIACDLHDADVVADLATADGRAALIEGVTRLSGGAIDAIVANAGGGPPETSLALNFFGTVATLEGLRPLLRGSAAPRAVAVSSIAALREPDAAILAACLRVDETAAIDAARDLVAQHRDASGAPDVQSAVALYGNAKHALQRWCRRAAPTKDWAGAGIALNALALGFFDTPAAAYVLSDPNVRGAMEHLVPLRGAFPGRAEDAAAALAWFVGPENSHVTGQVVFVDGGYECAARANQ